MATTQVTPFTSYSLTAQEISEGVTFGPYQKMFLQNQLSSVMLERATLEFNYQDPTKFAVYVNYLKGQADILMYLLDVVGSSQENKPAQP